MFTTRPELTGDFGMVATTHWLASAVGMGVLERGGNAFDAAVAAGFVLQVVEPHLNGPGGEVPILVWSEADGRATTICGQGTAPGRRHHRALHRPRVWTSCPAPACWPRPCPGRSTPGC